MENNKYKKSDLLKVFGKMNVIKNTSGPVTPSRTAVIKTMTDKILTPVGDQMSDKWDNRKYEQNDDLCMKRNFLTVKDLYSKVVTEATSQTPYRGLRLDLRSIDMAETHCKFLVERHGAQYIVELYYPNANEAISVSITDEMDTRKLYEVSLDSDQYTNNFGYSILKSIDDFASTTGKPDSVDTMLGGYMNGNLGSAMRSAEDTYLQPSALVMESVDWKLYNLKNICESVGQDVLLEDGEEDMNGDQSNESFGESDFSADAGGMGADDPNQQALDAGAKMDDADTSGGNDDTMTYSDACKEFVTTHENGVLDHMQLVLATRLADTGSPVYQNVNDYIKPHGLSELPADSIIKGFGTAYGFIDGNKGDIEMKAVAEAFGGWLGKTPMMEAELQMTATDNGNELQLPRNTWETVFMDLLGDNFNNPQEFNRRLGEAIPDMFDSNGNQKKDAATAISNVSLDAEDNLGMGTNDGSMGGDDSSMGGSIFGDNGFGDDAGGDFMMGDSDAGSGIADGGLDIFDDASADGGMPTESPDGKPDDMDTAFSNI